MLAQIAASGDFGQPSFIPCADPLLNASEKAQVCSSANQALQGNPYETYNGVNYPGLNLYILRRNVEGGARVADFITNNAREVFGVKGDITDEWTYNVSAQHSEVDGQDSNLNFFSNSAIQQSLNVLPGPSGTMVCGGPNNSLGIGPLILPSVATKGYTGPVAATGTAFSPSTGCVPYDLWASHGVTPAQLAYLSIPEQLQDTVTEYDVQASVTGDFGKYGVKLPFADDGLQVNVGSEWRSDSAQFNPDYVSQQGLAAGGGGATPAVAGAISVWEAFTELRLPLIQHQPLAEDLSLEGGYRFSSSTDLGFNTSTYKIGLEWAPTQDVRLRGGYNRAVRAPNISELYSPQSVGLDGSEDPCTGATPAGTLAQCERSGITKAEYGNLNANAARQYNGLLGGNPGLQPEIADTYTVGIVLTPRVVPNLQISVDYFDIKIKDVIETLGGNTIINGCVFDDVFCNLVHRDPANGSLWLSTLGYVTDTEVNAGQLSTRGFDVKGSYRQPLPALGSLLFGLEGTALQSLATTPVAGQGSYDCAGYFGDVCGVQRPQVALGAEHHLVDALGRARCHPAVALLRLTDLRAAQLEQVPGGNLLPPVAGAHPGLQLDRSVGHVQCLQERQAAARRQQHLRQGSADSHPGRLLDRQPGRRELQRQYLPGCVRRHGALSVRPHQRAVLKRAIIVPGSFARESFPERAEPRACGSMPSARVAPRPAGPRSDSRCALESSGKRTRATAIPRLGGRPPCRYPRGRSSP